MAKTHTIVVVIPAFKVSNQILAVLKSIPRNVTHIIVVDDLCPEGSGHLVESKLKDSRVEVIFHTNNLGVGGAIKTGYQRPRSLKQM